MNNEINLKVLGAFDEIMHYAHWDNWGMHWQIFEKIYIKFPGSYSVLTPFAYSYMEELIRSTTNEYGREIFDNKGNPVKKRKVGLDLIKLAIAENKENSSEYIKLLEEVKRYYHNSRPTDEGENRHSVAHGYMHPRFWTEESFEQLISDIARLSKYARF